MRELWTAAFTALLISVSITRPTAGQEVDIAKVVAGPWQACALATNGNLYCWQVVRASNVTCREETLYPRHGRTEASKAGGV